MMWWPKTPSRGVFLLPLGLAGLALAWVACGGSRPAGEERAAPPVEPGRGEPAAPPFREMAKETGLDFVHFNGMSGEYYYSEHMGGGGALFDYDRDGDLDLFLTQGHMLGPRKELSQATLPPPSGQPLSDRLFRNDL